MPCAAFLVRMTLLICKLAGSCRGSVLLQLTAWPHLSVDRSNTNRCVVQTASAIAYPNSHDHHSVKLFSEHDNERRASVLGM